MRLLRNSPTRVRALFGVTLALGISELNAASDWIQEDGYQFRELPAQQKKTDSPDQAGFTTLPAATSGIHFVNALSNEDILQNQNYMNGSGVAAGDFDGDGFCDLYFCSLKGSNALYRNLGNWQFKEVKTSSGIAMKNHASTGAVFVDINGDGKPDLLVSTLGQGVHSFLNLGKSQFRETTQEAGLETRTGSTSMALGDVDLDGDLDLYVVNYGEIPIVHTGGDATLKRVNGQWVVTGPFAKRLRITNGKLEELGEPDTLYLNDGLGSFEAVPWNSEFFLDEEGKPVEEPWEFGLAGQMRDIDQDGDIDIYVCNDFQSPDRFWINQGNGTFRAIPRLAMRKQSHASMGVDFADLDRDGLLDFFVVEMLPRDHSNRMTKVAGLRPKIPHPARINNRPDAARNTLFKNLGDGSYAEIAIFSDIDATDWSWQPVFLDVDLDGLEDLLVINGMLFDSQDRDTLERIRANGKQSIDQSKRNVLSFPDRKAGNMAFKNGGQWKFKDFSETWGFNHVGVTHGILLADLDNDGDQDVVTHNLNEPPSLYRNEAIAPRIIVQLKSNTPNQQGIGARIEVSSPGLPNQTQHILAGGRYLSGDAPSRTFATGSAIEGQIIKVVWPGGKVSLIENAKNNRSYLIQEPSAFPKTIQMQELKTKEPIFEDVSDRIQHRHQDQLFNDFIRQPLLPRLESQYGPSVAWADLDGDGVEELTIGTGRGGSLSVWRVQYDGAFHPVTQSTPWVAPDDTAGFTAWTWANGSGSVLFALSQYESGTQDKGPLMELSLTDSGLIQVIHIEEVTSIQSSPGPLASADMDGDGDLDLFIGGRMVPGHYPQSADSRLFRQTEGKLEEDMAAKKILGGIGMVQGALWCDLQRDGFPELILSCEWGPIQIFDNHQGTLRRWNPEITCHDETAGAKRSLSEMTGWWRGLTSGDLNEDGKLDLIVANWGLNDHYHASFEHPLNLYYGDFNETGRVDLLETWFSRSLNAEVPVRNFNELRQNFPMFQSFQTHQNFSKVSIEELIPKLPNPVKKSTAVELEPKVLLNRGTFFEMISLPDEAQWSPSFSVNVADYDNDGHEDVFLSQNFFATRPGWDRLDSGKGLWLKGDGTGQLKSIPASLSGIEVYGEQRGAALADFNQDGKIDLLTTQNAAQSKLYKNKTIKPGLSVKLMGPAGNPNSIGAIIQLETEQGMGPARMLHAGSGFGSQSAMTQILGFGSTPKKLHILWPGGNSTIHSIPSDNLHLTVKMPSFP